jgi:Ion transport protein
MTQCLQQGKSLRVNFDTFPNALQAVFVIIVGDDWNSTMSDYVRATSYATILFFVFLTIFGNIVLMNLFLAILLREFDNVEALREERMVNASSLKSLSIMIKSHSASFAKKLLPPCLKSVNLPCLFK